MQDVPQLRTRALDERRSNPPVDLILCTEKGVAEAHYALDNLSKVVAAEYRTLLPDEKLIPEQLQYPRIMACHSTSAVGDGIQERGGAHANCDRRDCIPASPGLNEGC